LPKTLSAPKLPGSSCSWRFYLDTFDIALDRPETTHLSLLPDTSALFLQSLLHNPTDPNQILMAVKLARYKKYDRFYFAKTMQSSFLCLLCGREEKDPITFASTCLGYPLLLDWPDFLNAECLSVFPTQPTLKPKVQSLLVRLDAKLDAAPNGELITLLDQLRLNYLVFSNEGLVTVWLDRILDPLPLNLIFHDGLDTFHSILYQSLHRHIVRTGRKIASSKHKNKFTFQLDLFQAGCCQ
jgi:hypothetical protein